MTIMERFPTWSVISVFHDFKSVASIQIVRFVELYNSSTKECVIWDSETSQQRLAPGRPGPRDH